MVKVVNTGIQNPSILRNMPHLIYTYWCRLYCTFFTLYCYCWTVNIMR